MKKNNTTKNNDIPDILENASVASATECTGLMQIPADNREEWELYNQSVRFAPPGSCDEKDGSPVKGDTKNKRRE